MPGCRRRHDVYVSVVLALLKIACVPEMRNIMGLESARKKIAEAEAEDRGSKTVNLAGEKLTEAELESLIPELGNLTGLT